MLRKAGIVLWKHYLIRKRHWFLTLIEVILPVLIFLILAFCRAKLSVIKKIEEPPTIHAPQDINYLDTLLTKIFYAPSNNVTDDIIHRLQENLQFPTSNVFSFANGDEMVDFYVKDNTERAIGIIFEEWENPKFKYTLRVHEQSAEWNNDKLFDSEVFKEQGTYYMTSGFLTIQQALDNAYIEKYSNKTISLRINLKGVPFPSRIRDVGVTQLYSSILPYITIFSFLLIIPAIVQRVVEEKKSGIKELQKMVGLKSWMIWFGWFMHGMIPALVSISTIVILMKLPFWGAEYPPIEFTNGFIYFIFLVLYCISTIFFCFLLSTITSKPTFSMVFTILIWNFSYFIPDRILSAYGSTRFLKILLAIFPNVALNHGYKIMQVYEQKEIGIQWSNIFELPLGGQNEICMFSVFIMFIVDVFIFILLTIYIDNINPGAYGIRQSVFFPIKKIKKLLSSAEVDVNVSRVEEANLLKPGIQLINLSKNFGPFKAVDDLSMNVDKDQITVLLGHNGAGKTTVMHMMTGMIEATEGAILIDNLNVRTDMDKIRQSLGLCPQHNLLFQDLNVLEHLLFFAMLKGISKAKALEQAKRLMVRLHLDDKKYTLARTLSGGMKRKLCLGMAIIGDPKVLILDEPTSGMDPESRREVWDMLKRDRESKTILITTHFLEEADVLGDKIAIMSHGKVLCHDTPLELKKKYNTGYHLSLSLGCDNEIEKEQIKRNILSIINQESVNASEVPSFGNTVCINLEIENKSKFPSFLSKIEDKKQALKIENMSLTLTKLEDVFLKSMDPDDMDTIDCKKIYTKATFNSERNAHIIKPLAQKRWYCLKRRKWYFAFTAILVGLLLIGNIALCQNYLFGLNMNIESKLDLNLTTYGTGTVYYQGSTGYEKDLNFYKDVVLAQKSIPMQEDNVDRAIIDKGTADLTYYKKHIIVGAEFLDDSINALHAFSALHSPPISVNLITNAVAKSYLGERASITVSAWPLAPKKTDEEPTKILEPQITLVWSFLFPIGIILLLCPYIIYPFDEMSTKFTTIQFMAGVAPWLYWFTNFLTDSAGLAVQIGLLLLLQLFQMTFDFNVYYSKESFGTFALIMLLMSISSLPYTYLFSRRPKLSAGVALYIILNLFMGLIPYTVVFLLKEFGTGCWSTIGKTLDVLLMILCPPYGYTAIGNYYSKQTTRLYNWNEMKEVERIQECRIEPNHPCCGVDTKACSVYTSYFGSEGNTLCLHLFYMILGAIFYMLVNIFLDKYFNTIVERVHLELQKIIHHHHEDNALEKQELISTSNGNGDGGFQATLLRKTYNNKATVDIKELKADKGKCLGFLGVNGAGKTTTFNIITKQILNENPKGEFHIGSGDNTEVNYLKKLGYCPQADLLNFTLTGQELLTVMANIRGIADVDKTVQEFLEMFDLTEHKDKMIKTYSGGNKRKLCAAVSFLGIKDVVLLDEPTSGVDAKSRRNFWKILKTYQFNNNLTTILTSHSMDECEALCDNLIILKEGTIRKNATISKLKEEISGYIVSFKLSSKQSFDDVDAVSCSAKSSHNKKYELERFKETMRNKFEDCILRDEHHGSLQYQITTRNRLSQIFKDVEYIKTDFPIIEDYSISESSVEDIFLSVARSNNGNDNSDNASSS